MQVNSIKMFSVKPAFGDIDSHAHEGSWYAQNPKGGEPIIKNYGFNDINLLLNKTSKDNKINKIIVSNTDCLLKKKDAAGGFPFIKNEYDGNVEILNKNNGDKRFAYYAVCQPSYGSVDNIKKVFEEHHDSFVGLKFHPQCLEIKADDKSYEPYMQFAKEHKLPCLFHSGVAIDWSKNEKGEDVGKVVEDVKKWDSADPRLIYNLAKKFPDVPVILGHTGSGGAPAHDVAIDVLKQSIKNKDANLYAEISWMDFKNDLPSDKPESFIKLVKACKKENALDKILFGSDAPLGCYGEKPVPNGTHEGAYNMTIDKFKNAIRNDEELKPDAENIIKMIFNDNAKKLFNLADEVKAVSNEVAENVEEKGSEAIEDATDDAVESAKKSGMSKSKIGMIVVAGVAIIGGGIYAIKHHSKAKSDENPNPALNTNA